MNRLGQTLLMVLFSFLMLHCGEAEEDFSDIHIPQIVKTAHFVNRIDLQWNKVNNAKKYEVEYAADKNMNDAVTKETKSLALEISDLQAGQEYYFKIRAFDGENWTKWSKVKKAETALFSTTIETFNVMGDRAYLHSHGEDYYEEYQIAGKDYWSNRRIAFRDLILASDNQPDILALQEVSQPEQLEDIVSLLSSEYDVHISSRIIDPRAIFWKKDKYSLVDFDDNIEGYDNTVSGYYTGRYVSHVRLKEKKTGKELLVFNIHPNSGSSAEKQRMRGILARRVADTAKKLSKKYHAPAIVLGDFNNYANTVIDGLPGSPMVLKSYGFSDTFDDAIEKTNAEYTSYDKIYVAKASKSQEGRKRLDYIFTYSEEKITVSDYRILIRFQGGPPEFKTPRPSDHHPVRSTLYLCY